MPTKTTINNVSKHLFVNKQHMKKLYENCVDFVISPLEIESQPYMMLMYLNSLIDEPRVNEAIINPIVQSLSLFSNREGKLAHLQQRFNEKQFAVSEMEESSSLKEINDKLSAGYIAIFLDGEKYAILINFVLVEERAIEEPTSEMAIRGPKDGFNESLQTNLNLIRQRIRSNHLKFIEYTIGDLTKTSVVVAYIDGIAEQSLVEEVIDRLNKMEVEQLISSELIEELIDDEPYTPFPLIQNTERPDSAIGSLFEGRVVILVDHTPFVLIAPMTFWNGFEATGDVYERFIYVTFIRLLRFLLLLVAVFLPSLYVALTTFHPKLIPTELLISIAAARENVPFPAIIEALTMELVFEALREAGLRLPKAIGQAVSIVGAIVIGQAAVEAGIVSAAMVIVVASTGIASFAIPKYNTEIALRLIRFPMLILAGVLGLFGVVVGFLVLMIHLVNLRSFGVAYFKPMAPQIPTDLKDILIKTPKRKNKSRTLFRFERS